MPDIKTNPYKSTSRNIVNQLFDLAEVDVDKRQAINDQADDWLEQILVDFVKTQNTELLEALKGFMKEYESENVNQLGASSLWIRAEEAIDKAQIIE